MTSPSPSLVPADEIQTLICAGVPMFGEQGMRVDRAELGQVWMSLPYRDNMVRPGGTVAGPVLFGLADAGLYAAVISSIGPVELAVTTNMTINFLRKPLQTTLRAEVRILKPGKRLMVGEVLIFGDGVEDGPVAHATGTYSVP